MSKIAEGPSVRRRRNHAEVEQLVSEYESSGLTQTLFCARRVYWLVAVNSKSKFRLMRVAVNGRFVIMIDSVGGFSANESSAAG